MNKIIKLFLVVLTIMFVVASQAGFSDQPHNNNNSSSDVLNQESCSGGFGKEESSVGYGSVTFERLKEVVTYMKKHAENKEIFLDAPYSEEIGVVGAEYVKAVVNYLRKEKYAEGKEIFLDAPYSEEIGMVGAEYVKAMVNYLWEFVRKGGLKGVDVFLDAGWGSEVKSEDLKYAWNNRISYKDVFIDAPYDSKMITNGAKAFLWDEQYEGARGFLKKVFPYAVLSVGSVGVVTLLSALLSLKCCFDLGIGLVAVDM